MPLAVAQVTTKDLLVPKFVYGVLHLHFSDPFFQYLYIADLCQKSQFKKEQFQFLTAKIDDSFAVPVSQIHELIQ